MLNRLQFAFRYALRNMARDRQRTAFALFSVAAGVATVVALRMLGIMLTDALTSNAQAILRGDITVQTNNSAPRVSFIQGGRNIAPFTDDTNIPTLNRWALDHGYDIQYAMTTEVMQTAAVQNDTSGRPAFALGYFIDPKTYPFYDKLRAESPVGATLESLLTGADQVVVSHRIAFQLGVKVGDTIRLGTAAKLQTV